MSTYFLYTIQAYEHIDVGTGAMSDVTVINLVSNSPSDANKMLKKARKMISKIGYRIAEITEYVVKEEGKNARTS